MKRTIRLANFLPAGRCPRPPFEGVVERSDFRITEQPGDLLQCHMLIFETTPSQVVPKTVEDFTEGSVLLSKVPLERPFTHPELLGDRCHLHPTTGKHAAELIFHQTP